MVASLAGLWRRPTLAQQFMLASLAVLASSMVGLGYEESI